jgi:hypothetical protein
MKSMLGLIFEPGKRNGRGELILRRTAGTWIFPLFGFLLAAIVFLLANDPSIMTTEEMRQAKQIMTGIMCFMGAMSVIMGVSTTVAAHDKVTTYRLFIRRSIRFEEIEEVSYIKPFAGCVVLRGARSSVRVPMDTRGFLEFYKQLKEHGLQAEAVERELKNRANTLESVGHRVVW